MEHPDQKSLAELFRSYVPASYEEIKAQLDNIKKMNVDIKVAQMTRFNEQFRNF